MHNQGTLRHYAMQQYVADASLEDLPEIGHCGAFGNADLLSLIRCYIRDVQLYLTRNYAKASLFRTQIKHSNRSSLLVSMSCYSYL